MTPVAFKHRDLALHDRPLVDVASDKIIGVEALVGQRGSSGKSPSLARG